MKYASKPSGLASSAPSPSAPSFRGGGLSALSSSLSYIPAARLLGVRTATSVRSATSPVSGVSAPSRNPSRTHGTGHTAASLTRSGSVVVARPVDMPKLRRNQAVLAQIVEEDSPHRPAKAQNTPASQSTHRHASQLGAHSNSDGAMGSARRKQIRVTLSGSRVLTHSNAVGEYSHQESAARGADTIRPLSSSGVDRSPIVLTPSSGRLPGIPTSSTGDLQNRPGNLLTNKNAGSQASAVMSVPSNRAPSLRSADPQPNEGYAECLDGIFKLLRSVNRRTWFCCAATGALLAGALTMLLVSFNCGWCWSWVFIT